MGKPVLTYTCNTPEVLDRAVAAGADGFMSDHPGLAPPRAGRCRRIVGAS